VVGLVLGSLRLPFVLLASGSPAAAAGTNIAVSAAAALAGGVAHARAGRVSWRIVAWMTPPSVAGAFVGGFFGHAVPARLLLAAIAAVLAWNGLDLLFELRAAPDSRRPRLAASVSGGLIGLLGARSGWSSARCECRRSSAASGSRRTRRWERTSSSASSSGRRGSPRTSSAPRSSGSCWS